MTKITVKLLLSLIIFCNFLILGDSFNQPIIEPQTAYAEDTPTREFKPATIPRPSNIPGPTDVSGENKSSRKILGEAVLPKIAVYIIGFTGGLSLLFLIIGGARFAMSYANEEDIGNAKNQVIYSLVGLLISMLSYAIVAIIINLQFEGDKTPSENAPQQSQPATP